MEYLTFGPLSRTQRLRRAEAHRAAGSLNIDIPKDMVPGDKILKLADNFDAGYFAVPDYLFTKGMSFDYKHGPFIRLAAPSRDLRPLKQAMYDKVPLVLKKEADTMPVQVTGFVASSSLTPAYIFSAVDLVSALITLDDLRLHDHLQISKPKQGVVHMHSQDGIEVTIRGLARNPDYESISRTVEGVVPSRTALKKDVEEERTYAPQGMLEFLTNGAGADAVNGIFRLSSGIAPWRSLKEGNWHVWNGNLTRDTPENSAQHLNLQQSILYHGILVTLIADWFSRREHGRHVNHPFLRLGKRWRQMTVDIYEQAIIVGENTTRRPGVAEAEMLLNMYMAARKDAFKQELDRFGETFGKCRLTHVSDT